MKTLPIDDHNHGIFFHKLGHFFPIFQKGQRRPLPLLHPTNPPPTPFSYAPVKASAFLQIFVPRKLLFRQVLKTSVFFNVKCLKPSNKRTHIPLFINQFVSLIELKM